jgi:hypothetical protein
VLCLWRRLRPIDHNYQVVIRKGDQKVFTQSVAVVDHQKIILLSLHTLINYLDRAFKSKFGIDTSKVNYGGSHQKTRKPSNLHVFLLR